MDKILIILGAMKCGSTSLFRYISEHPLVSPSSIKEPNFFSDDAQWKKGFRYYDALWERSKETSKSFRMEASVSYTKGSVDLSIIDRMKKSGRDLRFIYIVRDPFDRIESHYTHGLADNWEISRSAETVSLHAIDTTMYFAHIQPYIDAFGLANILVLDFAQLKSNPADTMKKVYDFLDIEEIKLGSSVFLKHNAGTEKRKYSDALRLAIRLNEATGLSRLAPKPLKRALKERFSLPIQPYRLSETQKQLIANALASDYVHFSNHFANQIDCKSWKMNGYLNSSF